MHVKEISNVVVVIIRQKFGITVPTKL